MMITNIMLSCSEALSTDAQSAPNQRNHLNRRNSPPQSTPSTMCFSRAWLCSFSSRFFLDSRAPIFWPESFGLLCGTLLVHIHGAVFSLWILLLIAQTSSLPTKKPSFTLAAANIQPTSAARILPRRVEHEYTRLRGLNCGFGRPSRENLRSKMRAMRALGARLTNDRPLDEGFPIRPSAQIPVNVVRGATSPP